MFSGWLFLFYDHCCHSCFTCLDPRTQNGVHCSVKFMACYHHCLCQGSLWIYFIWLLFPLICHFQFHSLSLVKFTLVYNVFFFCLVLEKCISLAAVAFPWRMPVSPLWVLAFGSMPPPLSTLLSIWLLRTLWSELLWLLLKRMRRFIYFSLSCFICVGACVELGKQTSLPFCWVTNYDTCR